MCEMLLSSSRPRPKMSCEPASRYRPASLPITVQWCPNQTSGGTERTTTRGTTTRSAQLRGKDPLPGDQDLEDLSLVRCRPASPLLFGGRRWTSLPRRFVRSQVILQPPRGSFQVEG